MGQYKGPERRRYPRITLDKIPVLYQVPAERTKWQRAVTGNAGEGGILLLTNELLPKDVVIQIEFHLSGRQPFIITGKVIWGREVKQRTSMFYKQGIEFIKVTDESAARFRQFLETAGRQVPSTLYFY